PRCSDGHQVRSGGRCRSDGRDDHGAPGRPGRMMVHPSFKVKRGPVVAALALCALSGTQALADGADLFAPSAEAGKALDARRALPLTAFYAKPDPAKPAGAGTLVRSEPATEYAVPPGVTATRILYHSRTADGADALASGVVLVPYGKPPKGGWPLLAW